MKYKEFLYLIWHENSLTNIPGVLIKNIIMLKEIEVICEEENVK